MTEPSARTHHPAIGYAGALLACGLCAALCLPLLGRLDQANIVMLFLLAVAAVTACWGKGPGVLAAFLSVLLFDVLFVEPRFSLAVHDGQYLVTFAVMLVVALLISQLATRLQLQLQQAQQREQQIRALYDCAHQLAGAMTLAQVQRALLQPGHCMQATRIALYLPDAQEQLAYPDLPERPTPPLPERVIIQSTYASQLPQFSSEFAQDGHTTAYLPLRGATRARGVLVLDWPASTPAPGDDNRDFLHTLSSLVATALERLHFVDVARSTELAMQAERLRGSILSSVSHDIRTPLTVLVGMADTLLLTQPALSGDSRALLVALRDQAFRLHGMVENLLDMARLQSGKVSLKREWLPLEELVGASIHLLGDALAAHTIRVGLPPAMPLVQADPLLMERVLCNLLDNARQHAPPGSTITVSAHSEHGAVTLSVCNDGAGFPADADTLLAPFARVEQESSVHGFGVGLAICRSIIEAHGGTIALLNPAAGGACVQVTWPQGSPPALEPEHSNEAGASE